MFVQECMCCYILFDAKCYLVDDQVYGRGMHSKKKKAQEEAARETLVILGQYLQTLTQCVLILVSIAAQGDAPLLNFMPSYLPVFKAYIRDVGLEPSVQWMEPVCSGPAHATRWTCSVTCA